MKVKLSEYNFQNLVSYWTGKLNLPLPSFRRDNRIELVSIFKCGDCNYFTFNYNFKALKTLREELIMSTIFHELGHIKYSQQCAIAVAEYKAETFSLECIKKYYPDYLDFIIEDTTKLIKDKKWRKKHPHHAIAFDRIKEYK